jgi:hypothetical protein
MRNVRGAYTGTWSVVRGQETACGATEGTPGILPEAALACRKPAPQAPPLNRVRLPKPLKLDVESIEALLEERQGHR